MGEEFSEQSVNDILEETLALLEGRPKGSKNKPKGGSSDSAPTHKDSSDEHDNGEEPDAHIHVQLRSAADLKGGKHVTFANGQRRHVSSDLAGKIVRHLESQKPGDREKTASDIHSLKADHPVVKAIEAGHAAAVAGGVKVDSFGAASASDVRVVESYRSAFNEWTARIFVAADLTSSKLTGTIQVFCA